MPQKLKNVHPGEVLLEEFLKPLGLSQTKMARAIGVTSRRINEIVLGRRGVTADTAIRFAYFFGTSEGFWMGLQDDFELEEVGAELRSRLKSLIRPISQNTLHETR